MINVLPVTVGLDFLVRISQAVQAKALEVIHVWHLVATKKFPLK